MDKIECIEYNSYISVRKKIKEWVKFTQKTVIKMIGRYESKKELV